MVNQYTPRVPLTGVISFTYTNWKNETRRRSVECRQVEYSYVPYLNCYTFTLLAYDLEKEATRSFLISEIKNLIGGLDAKS